MYLNLSSSARDPYFLAAGRAFEMFIGLHLFKITFEICQKILYFPNELQKLHIFRLAFRNVFRKTSVNVDPVNNKRKNIKRPKTGYNVHNVKKKAQSKNCKGKLISAISSVHELFYFLNYHITRSSVDITI